ncbi:Calx-beta domain-containing protein [Catenovulum agarivorans]|uniref:Calx-beta domain-containing protein n=1 Tax=Catenovulum agarivorans TaxID=1172192 RepID=UPI0002F400EA|nr:Calx-beta domain-containing protein [Catenovulum agarivorans]
MKTLIHLPIKVLIAVLCSLVFWVEAQVPEPQVTLYGQVFNRYQGIETRLSSGNLVWQIKADDGSGKLLTYATSLQPLADGVYDYRLDIPQRLLEQAITPSLTTEFADANTIAVGEDEQDFSHNLIAIDNVRTYILNSNQTQLSLSQLQRSQHIQIDLHVSKPPSDVDGDGLPDSWELAFFGDTTLASASGDEDEDGLTNLEEYHLSSDPRAGSGDNRIPTLIHAQISITEQGYTLFQPSILDSDTLDTEIDVAFSQISDSLQLSYLAGGSLTLSTDTVLTAGDTVKLSDLLTGHIVVKHMPESVDAQSTEGQVFTVSMAVNDKDNDVVAMNIDVAVVKPNDNQATKFQMWLDATVDQSLFSSYYNPDEEYTEDADEEWYGRSDRGELDLIHHIDQTGWEWADVKTSLQGPNGEQTIELDGSHYFESWAEEENDTVAEIPFHFNDELAYFAVFKSRSDTAQILTHDTQAEIALTASDDPYYPSRLRFSREGYESIYGTRAVAKDWSVVSLFVADGAAMLELNGRDSGFSYASAHAGSEDPSNVTWGTSRTIGGKMIGSANDENYQMLHPFKGSLGEVLMLNCGDCKAEKWRVYAYLYSKWFDYVVIDHSQTTYAVNAQSSLASYIGVPTDESGNYSSLDEALYELGDNLNDFIQTAEQTYLNQFGEDKAYVFIGGTAHNKFIGGSQDDILVSGRGSDWLTGLAGADLFVVSNNATVVDFNETEDVLDLTQLFDVEDPNIPLNKYIRFETDAYDSYLFVDANGDGSGYTDATVVLSNIAIRNNEIAKLWAQGVLQTGVVRPELELNLAIASQDGLEERIQNSVEFVLQTNGTPLPKGLSVPIALEGSAEFGKDYKLEYAEFTGNAAADEPYQWKELLTNGIPLNVASADSQIKLRITPIKDNVAEVDEQVQLRLMPLSAYKLGQNAQASFVISDGLPEISVIASNTSLIEGLDKAAQVTFSRNGSLNVPLKVQLEIVGSASNGVDYGFISKEITFAQGQQQTSIEILPYADSQAESTEFIEIAIAISPNYEISDLSSVRVGIFETDAVVDSDGDGMDDMWEIEHGLDFNKNDKFLDADGDGLVNIKEYSLGLNPTSSDTDNDGIADKLDRSPDDASDTTQIDSVGTQHIYAGAKQIATLASDVFTLHIHTKALLDSGATASGLDGLGVRIHYNSQLVKFDSFSNIYATDFVFETLTPVQDFADFDYDSRTDSYVELRWSKLTSDWLAPNKALAGINFTVLAQPTQNSKINFSASQLSVGYELATQPVIVMQASPNKLDLNNDGQSTANKEALAVMRYMTGLRGDKVKQDVATTALDNQLSQLMQYMDLDADGEINALTDGLLLSRCIAGYQGDALVEGIINSQSGRKLPESILQICRQFTE